MTVENGMRVSALAGWFGAGRTIAENVGAALAGCSWVGIPFAGSMSEVPYIGARTILCNDKHRHVINLARVIQSDRLRPQLIRSASEILFHPDELAEAQEFCKGHEPGDEPDLACAVNYFVCCWIGRRAKAGLIDEFNGRPSVRWKSDGGNSSVRYWSALRSLAAWRKPLAKCTFETMDALDFLDRCEDIAGCGIYIDSPFPGAGRRYRHNAGQTDAEERTWHERLRDSLERFKKTRIVARFYEHPLIRELYGMRPGYSEWEWLTFTGRKQTNDEAQELLLVRNREPSERSLF